jgi:cysteine desulfuration protein SufE
MSAYPVALAEIIELFEHLPEEEKRENLIVFADQAAGCAPKEGEAFELVDSRKDEECTDTVTVHLAVDAQRRARFAIELGPHVQTLTRAMAAILCKGLNGSTPDEIMSVEQDFVPRIVGSTLVRVRSQSVYYILTRMKSAAKVWLNRERSASGTVG